MVKKIVKKIVKIFLFTARLLKKLIQNQGYRKQILYAYYIKTKRINENIILYESFHGKSMTDNPYAIFKGLVFNQNYKDYLHVWVLNDLEDNKIANEYRNLKNVRFVTVGSKNYMKYLSSAGILINNVTFPPYFQKKDNQVYINTWHGTPLKTLGKDMKGTRGQHKNIQRNFLQSDFILSPNEFTTDVLVRSHDLSGIYTGRVIEEGYPRIDLISNSSSENIKYLSSFTNVDVNKKVILYAPTWRGEVGSVEDAGEELSKYIRALNSQLSEEYVLLIKVHSLMYKYIKGTDLEEICVPDWVDTNELLSAVDVLITDYSSIFFDYLVTGKPILFFMYDKEKYLKDRGVYLDFEELPGPISRDIDELIKDIGCLPEISTSYKVAYEKMHEQYCKHDDGHVTERIIDIIFNKSLDYNVRKFRESNRRNILLYGGGFNNNGITTSLVNLVNNIDYSKYNVTIIDKGDYSSESERNISKIIAPVNVIYRVGGMNLTLIDFIWHNFFQRVELKSRLSRLLLPYTRKLYLRELQRMLGNSEFEYAIDFSGYVPFWTTIIGFGNFHRKVIYQHNDMKAETQKVINGEYKHRRNLKVIFSMYPFFDRVVSVSEQVKDLNYRNLSNYIRSNQITYVHNSINYNELIHKAQTKYGELPSGFEDYTISKWDSVNNFLNISAVRVPNDKVKFVNMGRLSPEKDQEKLIRAFAKIAKTHVNVILYIIGSGSLEKQLKILVKTLDLSESVIFTGQLENPFILINKCDCFVLSSNHEGQPMALLEAMILSRPIISTSIEGTRSVLKDGYGKLVENSVEGLAQGLLEFIENGIDIKKFDYQKYNEEAMDMFYRRVCEINSIEGAI